MPLLVHPDSLSRGYLDIQQISKLDLIDIEKPLLIEVSEEVVIKECLLDNCRCFILQNNENYIVSIIRLIKKVINNEEFYLIDKSKSFVERKGYATILYEYCFCYCDLPVISGSLQTKPGSSDLWKMFQKKQENSNYEILVFNTQTNHKGIFITRHYSDYDVWGWYMDFIEMAKSDPSYLEESLKYKDLSIELFDFLSRDINKIRNRDHILLIGKKR